MFNIGTGEIILIAVAALLVLGPAKLPEFARGIGKLMREFRRQTDDVRSVVEREFYKMDQDFAALEAPPVVPQPAPHAVAQGDFEGDTAAHEALPAPPSDAASQVLKGAPAGVERAPEAIGSADAPAVSAPSTEKAGS